MDTHVCTGAGLHRRNIKASIVAFTVCVVKEAQVGSTNTCTTSFPVTNHLLPAQQTSTDTQQRKRRSRTCLHRAAGSHRWGARAAATATFPRQR